MIPILYESNESTFTSNGVCRLVDCVSCEVTEERNGVFECEFTYPITGRNYDKIKEGMIIYTTHDESGEPQPFDIYKRSVPIDGVVTFNAAHISYRLRNYILKPFTAASISETFASLVPNATPASCPFTFWTDKEVESAFTLNVPKSIRSVLGGEEGSILDVYGTGEYEFDKFAVKLHLHRGQDTTVKIQYGKNLIDLSDETDAGNLYNAVVPYWLSSEEGAAPVMLAFPYYVTASDFDPETEQVIPIVLDLSSNFQEEPTAEQLAARARAVLDASETRKGTRTIEVDFVQLWQTEQYKDIAPLERLNLCDTVEVIYGGTSVAQKITTVVYDSLLDRYKSMELGATTQTLADALMASMERAISEPVRRAIDKTAASIKHATDMITGNEGGYVVLRMNDDGQPMELLICDTPDYLTARNVWRWNQNGLGFSSNGYAGPYGTAITADGAIIANYVKTGILSSLDEKTQFNLNTGEFISSNSQSKPKAIKMTGAQFRFFSSKASRLDTLIGWLGTTTVTDNYGNTYDGYGFFSREGTTVIGYYDDEKGKYISCIHVLGDDYQSDVHLPGDDNYYYYPLFWEYNPGIVGRTSLFRNTSVDSLLAYGYSPRSKLYQINTYWEGDEDPDKGKHYINAFLNSGGNPYGITNRTVFIDPAVTNKTDFYYLERTYIDTETGDKPISGSALTGTIAATQYTDSNQYVFMIRAKSGGRVEISSASPNGVIKTGYVFNTSRSSGGILSPYPNYFRYGVEIIEDLKVGGEIECQSLTQTSDVRRKSVLDWDDRFDVLIDKLRPVLFDWKERKADDYHHIGLIAQDVEKEMRALGLEDCIVHTAKDGEKSIAYSEVSTLLLKKVQQQQTKIDALEERIARLEALIGG